MSAPSSSSAPSPLSELRAGAFVITDVFADQPAEIAFRTLVHIDGDVCLSVATRALSLPDFDAQLAAHAAHVSQTIESRQALARGLVSHLSRALGAAGPLTYVGARLHAHDLGAGLERLLASLAEQLITELLGLALACAAGLALSLVARRVAQLLLRRALGKIGAA